MYCVNHGPPPSPVCFGASREPHFYSFFSPFFLCCLLEAIFVGRLSSARNFRGKLSFPFVLATVVVGGRGEWKMKDLYVSFFHSHFRKYRILLLWEYSC